MLLHKKSARLVLLLLCSISTSTLLADDYIIELLIFENLNVTATEEQWLTDFQEATNKTAASTTVDWQSASSYQLANTKASLERSSAYQPLLHTAWRQPISKKIYPVLLSDRTTAESGAYVTGTVSVTKGRYLHLDLDLTLQAKPDTSYIGKDYRFGSETTSIKLQHKRRMRSKELHYIDHPGFGVLALITPVE